MKQPKIKKEDCAVFDQKEGYVVTKYLNDPIIGAMEEAYFDQVVEQNIIDINKKLKQIKFLKKVCILKIIEFPLEYIYTRIFISKKLSKTRVKEFKLMISFLFNKLEYEDFNIGYNNCLKETI